MALFLVLAVVVGSAAAASAAATTGCTTDLGCSLNGACDAASGRCACDKGWSGATCDSLHLDPTAHVSCKDPDALLPGPPWSFQSTRPE